MMFIIIVTGILSTFDLISGYKLLLVFPYPSRSHSILGQGYVTHLIKAGHEVSKQVKKKKNNDELEQIYSFYTCLLVLMSY